MSTGAKKAMADQDNQSAEILSPAPEHASERGPRDRARRRHRNAPRHLESSINMNELRELIGLITENSLTQFELEREGFHVKIGRGPFFDEQAANAQLAAAAGCEPCRARAECSCQCATTPGRSGRRGRIRRSGPAQDHLADRGYVLPGAFANDRQFCAHRESGGTDDRRLHHRSNEADE